jgi:hypothetical protein
MGQSQIGGFTDYASRQQPEFHTKQLIRSDKMRTYTSFVMPLIY